MSIADKLSSILNIKSQIRTAIASKGIQVSENTPFSEYPAKIGLINAIIDNTPPVIEIFEVSGDFNGNGTIKIKTEVDAIVVLKNSRNETITLTKNTDGMTYTSTFPYAVEGTYTLTVTDLAGNISTQTRGLSIPKDYALTVFKAADHGAYFDFTDLSTIYQDANLATQATLVGQIVGGAKDKTNRGWQLIQATASRQPQVGRSSLGINTILFDGIDDILSSTLSTPFNYVNATIIVSGEFRASRVNISLYDSSSDWGLSIVSSGGNMKAGIRYDASNFSSAVNLAYSTPSMGDTIALTVGNGLPISLSTNSTSVSANSAGYTGSLNKLNINSNNDGNMYKLLIINRILTTEEITQIRRYFNASMGIY